VRLRPSVSRFPFDAQGFARLHAAYVRGELAEATSRLASPPPPPHATPRHLADLPEDVARRLREAGLDAIRAGRVAALIMAGGMATRFGGGAKGACPLFDELPSCTFLAVKLADLARRAAQGAGVPAVIMSSFATAQELARHAAALDWSGVAPGDRYELWQSLLPRVLLDGTILAEVDGADALADTEVYTAPGHGDTLGRLRASGLLAALRARGVEDLVVSNVDNLGATLDPLVLGAHLEAREAGAAVTVEVVRREDGDVGACVAFDTNAGRDVIFEGFRLPPGTDLTPYPHFNTNTLWFSTAALDRDLALQWFPVRKTIELPGSASSATTVVQFEQLVGQVCELVPAAFVEVDRAQRFLPIKARDDLRAHRAQLARLARAAGVALPPGIE
jgi:UTP--glucose-1-phosphate uridylyltransferase